MKKTLLIFACALVLSVAANAQKTSMDYLGEGSRFYINGEYQKAILPYKQALDLEKKERKLEKKFWIVLVDNLGMSYGITGDINASIAVFEYGLKK